MDIIFNVAGDNESKQILVDVLTHIISVCKGPANIEFKRASQREYFCNEGDLFIKVDANVSIAIIDFISNADWNYLPSLSIHRLSHFESTYIYEAINSFPQWQEGS